MVLAFAYALGVLVDRVSDSILKPWDDRIRDRLISNAKTSRLTILAGPQPLAQFVEYQRSRARIARSTAVNIPPAICAFLLLSWSDAGRPISDGASRLAILFGGLALLVVVVWAWRRIMRAYYETLKVAYDVVAPPVDRGRQ